ncbi:MAG: hypothetical protein K2N44_19825 [Lachnospiraceae bacterium]|nr:hypothetical protein [Lachnospiraceae bacterium]
MERNRACTRGYKLQGKDKVCQVLRAGQKISKTVAQVCDARIMEHSRKPDEIRHRIAELCGDVPRIELFARQRHEGWDCLGDEIDVREAILEV